MVSSKPEFFWLFPVKGLFPDIETSFGPIGLGESLTWKERDDEDWSMIEDFNAFYQAQVTSEESADLKSASTVIRASPTTLRPDPGEAVRAFLLSASLHTSTPLWGRWMMFELQPGEIRPGIGGEMMRTLRLPGWGEQQQLPKGAGASIALTLEAVTRARRETEAHSFFRAIGSYWVAITSRYLEAVSVLLCATLEALAASSKDTQVRGRLLRRFPEQRVQQDLELLYRLRHGFAHGLSVRGLGTAEDRMAALSGGLAATKFLLAAALADDELYDAASLGPRATKRLLGP